MFSALTLLPSHCGRFLFRLLSPSKVLLKDEPEENHWREESSHPSATVKALNGNATKGTSLVRG